MIKPIEFSVITETYNLEEGSSWDRFREVLRKATAMVREDGSGEVLVVDSYGSSELEKMIAQEFPEVRRIEATGLGYDKAKKVATKQARGRYVLFLDGDCIPQPGWHVRLLEVLRNGGAVACGGFTRYDGGFLAAIMSVMDFGFFYPVRPGNLECYTSNNCGFLRETLEDVPVPGGDLRCRCFYHAQLLLRRGTPVQLVPEARVLHEVPPIVRERTRQGYDRIAALWADRELPHRGWLRWGMLSVPLFYAADVRRDWKHILAGRKDLGLNLAQVVLALLLFPFFRLLDVFGMLRAFVFGPVKGGWGGFCLE